MFVSYVSEDSGAVQQLRDDLKSYGAHIWLDRNAIDPGMRWKQTIQAWRLTSTLRVVSAGKLTCIGRQCRAHGQRCGPPPYPRSGHSHRFV
ncbi:MAG: toll/interleukin-1 receptor domain-containing protein [Gammaproteobacteria bacterium]